MKVETEYVTIAVKTINIDGESFKVDDLIQFTEVACDHENYIDKIDGYSEAHIYFNPLRKDEVRIEKMLLEQGVIREHGHWSELNDRVRNGEIEKRKSENYIRYKLTPKYHQFYNEVWEAINKHES